MAGLVPAIHVLLAARSQKKAWMPGHRRAEATPSFGRLCPGMTVDKLTIFPHPAVAEHINHALPDRRLGGLERARDAELDHQRPHGAAMGDGDGVGDKRIEPLAHA